jgi:hypothetical protein
MVMGSVARGGLGAGEGGVMWVQAKETPRAEIEAAAKRYGEAVAKFDKELPDLSVLKDAEQRKKLKEKVAPAAKELISAMSDFAKKINKQPTVFVRRTAELNTVMYLVGDEQVKSTVDELNKDVKLGELGDVAQSGKLGDLGDGVVTAAGIRVVVEYMAAKTPEKRAEVLKALGKAGKKYGELDDWAGPLEVLLAVTDDTAQQDAIVDVMRDRFHSLSVEEMLVQFLAPRKLKSLMNTKLSWEGKTWEGKEIKSTDYEGKVVMLFFFEVGEDNRDVNKAARVYITNKSKGVELVGVNCNKTKGELTLWLADYKKATWPILFDEFIEQLGGGWHPMTRQIGISKLPTMLLIDRKGVLRYANPDNTEAKVKELLEEK